MGGSGAADGVHGLGDAVTQPVRLLVVAVATGSSLTLLQQVDGLGQAEGIVLPLLYRWQGTEPPERPTMEATMTRKTLSPMR